MMPAMLNIDSTPTLLALILKYTLAIEAIFGYIDAFCLPTYLGMSEQNIMHKKFLARIFANGGGHYLIGWLWRTPYWLAYWRLAAA
jgi:hypothetical protein